MSNPESWNPGDLRPEDFRTAWPTQLKVLIAMIGALQTQDQNSRRSTSIETTRSSQEFRDSKDALSNQVGELCNFVNKTFTEASDKFDFQIDQSLGKLNDANIKLQSKIDRLSKLEGQMVTYRSSIMTLTLWGRLWFILSGKV
jgi:hypothetical protein